jgi:hypothetical protein
MPISSGLSVETIIKHHLINPLVVSSNHLNMGRQWESKSQFVGVETRHLLVFPLKREIP